MTTLKIIDGDMTVNQAIQARPETVAVFLELGFDACCGGSLPIREASAQHGIDMGEVLQRLNEAGGAARMKTVRAREGIPAPAQSPAVAGAVLGAGPRGP
jgi:iron-sulfur cluster repair protein YtfE (RIC family)